MNGGIPFQTSLRKDSSQAASKILPVYRIQLSSTKSQTCTSVTVERQKAIHTPTMAPAAKDSHQEMEGSMEWWIWGTESEFQPLSTPLARKACSSAPRLCAEKDQEFYMAKSYIPTVNVCSWYVACNFRRRTAKSSHYYPRKLSRTIQLQWPPYPFSKTASPPLQKVCIKSTHYPNLRPTAEIQDIFKTHDIILRVNFWFNKGQSTQWPVIGLTRENNKEY